VEGETTYTVGEAAALLQETPERVLEMLSSGDLEGIPPGATVSGEWKVLLPTSLEEDPAPEAPPDTVEDAEQPQEAPQSAPAGGPDPPTTEKLSRGNGVATDRELTAPSGWVSTQQAARALGISPRTVRWHIEQGNLEAKPEGEGVKRTWLVSIDSLQAFRDTRRSAGDQPRSYRTANEDVGTAAEGSGVAIRVLAERLEEAAARAAEYRVRLQLTEQAESTLGAELEEARRRREDAERERDELRRELQALRERRESPVSPGPTEKSPTESPTEAGEGAQEAREATQSAAETLRGPTEPPTAGGAQQGLQRPAQPSRRGRLWQRVFGR
jgi:hypothetical protein